MIWHQNLIFIMNRKATDYLNTWLVSRARKPLVIRGARQVGKTWIVREFAKLNHLSLIEVNFEKRPDYADLFNTNDPQEILLRLSGAFNLDLQPEKCLLFLDEIQAAPSVLSQLRWFAEDCAELPVIAAGSLLEFILEDHAFSMPVGRITYMHLEPMSFEEFLLALGQNNLLDFLNNFNLARTIPTAIHTDLLTRLREYLIVGGLPAVVSAWVETRSLQEVSRVQHDLLATYQDDFAKYRGKLPINLLHEIMTAVPKLLGEKFVFSRISKETQSSSIKNAFKLLTRARICHKVNAAHGNGIPLNAELKSKYFKAIFLDVGLCISSLRLSLTDFNRPEDFILVNEGGVAEQLVGQLLRTLGPFYQEPELFYWLRDEPNASAEIDYLYQHGNQVIPIEVKAGSTGSLKSLHWFMEIKNYQLAVRTNADLPSQTPVSIKSISGKTVEYSLLSIPFYLIEQLPRLLRLDQ